MSGAKSLNGGTPSLQKVLRSGPPFRSPYRLVSLYLYLTSALPFFFRDSLVPLPFRPFRIRCRCEACLGRKKVDPSVFERHSKCREGNWRESIRVARLKTSLSGWVISSNLFRHFNVCLTGTLLLAFLYDFASPIFKTMAGCVRIVLPPLLE